MITVLWNIGYIIYWIYLSKIKVQTFQNGGSMTGFQEAMLKHTILWICLSIIKVEEFQNSYRTTVFRKSYVIAYY